MLGERLSERCIRLVRGHVGIVGGNGDWALGWQMQHSVHRNSRWPKAANLR